MDNQNVIFRIKNLKCEYTPNKTVLKIDELEIKGNQLLFFVGVSGVGKSTLIETLGLMNNTFGLTNANAALYSSNGDFKDLSSFWGKEDALISKFRENNFSFIFQNNNLMSSLSSGENMCVGQMVNEDVSFEEAKVNVLKAISQLFPKEKEEEIFNKAITDLSGGQRQRLTFIRAITSSFKVLFCDEPTGNLDKKTARNLMEILKKALESTKSLGVIVSHDMDLAQRYGDKIICITPKIENGKVAYGEIYPKNVLTKNANGIWIDIDGKPIEDDWFDRNVFI